MLWSSKERLEARVVVKLALQCRDPLAPLDTLCRAALKTATDLGTLLRTETWRQVEEACPDAHAGALLNLCEAILASPTPHNEKRRQRIREIRPRVKRAAAAELTRRREEIERIAGTRDAALPNLWSLLANFVARNKKPALDSAG